MDLSAELENLERLFREGTLSDREYAAAKAALIQRFANGDDNPLAPAAGSRGNTASVVSLLAGIVFIVLGIFMSIGCVALIMDPKRQAEVTRNWILLGLMGVAPFMLGCLLSFRRRR